jgi:hypothetical protein
MKKQLHVFYLNPYQIHENQLKNSLQYEALSQYMKIIQRVHQLQRWFKLWQSTPIHIPTNILPIDVWSK